MNGHDEQRQVWVVIGPLNPDKLPAGCRAEKLAPAFVQQTLELVRLLEKLARLHGDLSA